VVSRLGSSVSNSDERSVALIHEASYAVPEVLTVTIALVRHNEELNLTGGLRQQLAMLASCILLNPPAG